MVDSCDNPFNGKRDKAILLSLLDTGARAHEFLALNIDALNYTTGALIIREGKGGKFRSVFLGKKARRTVRTYLRERIDESPAFWIKKGGERFSYWGLREVIRRYATRVGVRTPTIHSFRRMFALNMPRAGVDIFSLQELMGHADLRVLRKDLAQSTEDIAHAYKIGSPVYNARF